MLLTTFLILIRSFDNFEAESKNKPASNLKTTKSANLYHDPRMINIPCDQLEVSGENSQKCPESAGTIIYNAGSTISYTFAGVKVQVLAKLTSNSATGTIMIDNRLVKSFDSRSDTPIDELIFSSKELRFDDHTIVITHNGTNGNPIQIISLFIESYPIRQGFALGFDSVHDYTGDWNTIQTSIPNVDAFASNSNNAACTFKFYGTRFWLTGIRSSEYGNLDLILDYGRTINIRNKPTNQNLQNHPNLLYESPELEFKEHTVTIHRSDGPIAIIKLLFSIYPYHKIPTYPDEPQSIPISIPVSNMTRLTADNTPRCWSPKACPENEIEVCGEVCENNAASKLEYEYRFKGECFQVYGSKINGVYDIYLDGMLIKTVKQTDTSNYHLDYTSEIYPYGEHTIKISGTSAFSIYKIAFWPSIRAKRINLTDFTGIGEWAKETDYIGGIRYNTFDDDTRDISTSIPIRASNIWLYGTLANWHKKVHIRFADRNDECDLEFDPRIDFALVHEMQFNRPQEDIFTIDVDKGTVQFNYIYYIEESITSMPVSIPLSKMTINSTNYAAVNLTTCQNNFIGLCGEVWTIRSHAPITFTFRGERFQIYGQHGPDRTSYDIFADNVYLTTVYQYNLKTTGYVLDYLSDILPYGDHTILIEGPGPFSLHKLTYWPSLKAKRIDITSFQNRANWKNETDLIGGERSYSEGITTITHPAIHANKFWLFGTKASWHHNGSFIFGLYINEFINEHLDTRNERIDFEVLYDSPYFTNREAEVTIKTKGTFTLNYLYYLDEQPLSMPIFIPPNEMTKTGAFHCDAPKTCNEDINNYPCGQKCWTTERAPLSFEYQFKGECFEVYGNHGDGLTAYSIYLDGVPLFQPDQATAQPRGEYLLDYTSIIVPYGLHTIKAEGTQGQKFEIFRFAYWPCVGAKRINATDLPVTGGVNNWNHESDGIGGLALKNTYGGTLRMTVNLEKIWIYGAFDQTHTDSQIQFGNINDRFTLHTDGSRTNFTLVYDSPVDKATSFQISAYTGDGRTPKLYFHYVYYLGGDHLIIPTPSPRPTAFFSQSEYFTSSVSFSPSEYFTSSVSFSQSEYFTSSVSFSRSENFTSSVSFSHSDFFTTSEEFTKSQQFSTSSDFTESFDFTQSNSLKTYQSLPFTLSTLFTESLHFSKSVTFSKSNVFTFSTSFTESNTLVSIAVVTPLIDENNNETKSSIIPIIIGVVVAILVLLIIALVIIMVALKKRRKDSHEVTSETEFHSEIHPITMIQDPEEIDDINSNGIDIFEQIVNNNEDSDALE